MNTHNLFKNVHDKMNLAWKNSLFFQFREHFEKEWHLSICQTFAIFYAKNSTQNSKILWKNNNHE